MYSKIVQQLTNWWIAILPMKITVTNEWCRQGLKKYIHSKYSKGARGGGCRGKRQIILINWRYWVFYWLFLQQLRSFEIILHQSIHTELYLLSLLCFSVLPSGWSCWPWFSGRRRWGWKHNYSDREQKHSDTKIYTGFSGPQVRQLSLTVYHVQKGLRRRKGSTFSSRRS